MSYLLPAELKGKKKEILRKGIDRESDGEWRDTHGAREAHEAVSKASGREARGIHLGQYIFAGYVPLASQSP